VNDATKPFVDIRTVEVEASPIFTQIVDVNLDVRGASAKFIFRGSHLAGTPVGIFFDDDIDNIYDDLRTPEDAKIIQDPPLGPKDGPQSPSPEYSITVTGLDLNSTHRYRVIYDDDRFDASVSNIEGSFTTGSVALSIPASSPDDQPHKSIRLRFLSGRSTANGSSNGGFAWSAASTQIALSRRTVTPGIPPLSPTYGAWVPINVQFGTAPEDFDAVSRDQFLVDSTSTLVLGTEYQYMVTISGTGDEFKDSDGLFTRSFTATTSIDSLGGNPTPVEVVFGASTPITVTRFSREIELKFEEGRHLAGAPIWIRYRAGSTGAYTSLNRSILVDSDSLGATQYYYTLTGLEPNTAYEVEVFYDDLPLGGNDQAGDPPIGSTLYPTTLP
jgi:hypothetical protein